MVSGWGKFGKNVGIYWQLIELTLILSKICTIGHIVVASSTNANAVIAGMAIAGFGGGNCQVSMILHLITLIFSEC
jgi:hypothetical protein